MGSISHNERRCWVTLITKNSYLPGVVVLSHSLDKHKSKYPLIVQFTSSLDHDAVDVIENEAKRAGRIIPMHVEPLLPPRGRENKGAVAERFADTFTKLRAFEVYKFGFTQACFLDADTAAFQKPDEIFETTLPDRDWIAANHSCVCNLDNDSWAPTDWTKDNCAYTSLTDPDKVASDISSRPTYRLLNGGLFMFYPSQRLWQDLLMEFNNTENLAAYQFPDQDFLAQYYKDKWLPVSWKFNAIKTMRYWHPFLWSDEKVVIVHYIVDKPWDRPMSSAGVAGYRGQDGETHKWWWDLFYEWYSLEQLSPSLLNAIEPLVGKMQPFTQVFPLQSLPGTLQAA